MKEKRGWDTLYWAIDIHDTIVKANYSADELPKDFFPLAKETLQRISNRKDCCLVLFTCSYPHETEKYKAFFQEHGIEFKYVNENPEAKNTAFGHFEKKFYFNFLLDDKAGFLPEDWSEISAAIDELEASEGTILTS